MKTIYNLQVCRAIAAIIVLLDHGTLMIDPDIFHGFWGIGWCGVDLFFVLSGFIIYYVNHKYMGMPAKFKQYMGRRLCRIYPIYWIYTITVIILYTFLFHTKFNFDYVARSLTLYPFHTELAQFPIIPPAHTLVYEVVFYVIFSVGILTSRKIFLGTMLFWLLLILVNMFTGGSLAKGLLATVVLNPINIEFFYGCIIAWLIINKPFSVSRSQGWILLFLGVALLAVSWVTQLNNYGILLAHHYLKFGISFSIIIYALSLLEGSDSHGMVKKLFVKLGDASYSIYLIHYIGLVILNNFILSKLTHVNSLGKLAISLVALIATSYYAYKWIEQPLIKYYHKKLK
jgi:exopolysaccharide production protein ExoZ